MCNSWSLQGNADLELVNALLFAPVSFLHHLFIFIFYIKIVYISAPQAGSH